MDSTTREKRVHGCRYNRIGSFRKEINMEQKQIEEMARMQSGLRKNTITVQNVEQK